MSKGVSFSQLSGAGLRIGIVWARWNEHISGSLRDGCVDALKNAGVNTDDIVVVDVPGSFEVVRGAKHLIDTHEVDAVVCIGALIKGETKHFEYICDPVSHGIMRLNLDTGVPVIFGVLTCLSEEQAVARSTGENNHGVGWGNTAVEMALLCKSGS